MPFKRAIWGPPGSGKTRRLVRTVEEKVGSGETQLWNVAAGTFRKSLAEEFKKKLVNALDVERDDLREAYIGTTHGICYRLLVEENYRTNVVQPEDREDFCEEFGVDYSREERETGLWASVNLPEKRELGNYLFTIHSFLVNNPGSHWLESPAGRRRKWELDDRVIGAFREEWADYKKENGLVDFDDMLRIVHEENLYPPVKILLEDEFHDKTPLQYEIYEQWADRTAEVHIAGDPLQAMYPFWGTDPEFFKREFEGADEQEVLNRSYRFSPGLWRYAKKIIEKRGFDIPDVKPVGQETKVDYLNMRGFQGKVREHEDDQVLYLARTNYLLKKIARVLNRLGIPYSVGYERGVGAVDVYNAVCKLREELEGTPVLSQQKVELKANETEALISSFPAAFFREQKKKLEARVEETDPLDDTVQFEVTPKMQSILKKKNPFYELLKSAPVPQGKREHLAEMWQRRGGKPIEERSQHIVTTIHGAKGREADVVFLFDPITRSIWEGDNEREEAMIFYVGATRARRHLYLIHMRKPRYNYDLPVPDRGSKLESSEEGYNA